MRRQIFVRFGVHSSLDSTEFIEGGDLMSPSLASVTSSESAADFEGNPHSRLKNEFFYIDFLGRGGFGDVILARCF